MQVARPTFQHCLDLDQCSYSSWLSVLKLDSSGKIIVKAHLHMFWIADGQEAQVHTADKDITTYVLTADLKTLWPTVDITVKLSVCSI